MALWCSRSGKTAPLLFASMTGATSIGHRRALQVEKALACVVLMQGPIRSTAPVVESTQPAMREQLFDGPHFRLWRLKGAAPFAVGAADEPRVLVCLNGIGSIEHNGAKFTMEKGAVM